MSSETLFIPDNPQQDLGLGLLDQLITGNNGLIDGAQPLRSVIQQMLAVYSSAILVIAGFVVIYYLILTIVDAAQTGKAFRRINPLWGPLRLCIAIGLLVPLPMGGVAGLNSGQFIVVKFAEWGSGLASRLWSLATEDISTIKPMITVPKPVPALALVRAMVLKDACLGITNLLAQQAAAEQRRLEAEARKNDQEPPPARPTALQTVAELPDVKNADGSTTTPYGWMERPYFCGAVTVFPASVETDQPLFWMIKQAHIDALTDLRQHTRLYADNYVSLSMGNAAKEEENMLAPRRSPTLMAERYQNTLADAMGKEFGERLDSQLERSRLQLGNLGWVGAPGYLDTVLRLNLRLLSLNASLPQIDPPELLLSPPNRPGDGSTVTTPEYRVYKLLMTISQSWGSAPSVPPISAAGLSGLSTLLSHSVTLSREVVGAGATGHQLRAARDMLRTNDYNWSSFGKGNPLVSLAELGAYLTGKSIELLAGAGVLNNVGAVTGPTVSMLTVLGIIAFFTSIALLLLLPLIPLVRFFIGIAVWLVQIFEALVAIPLVALAHLRIDEDGLAGRSAVLCYVMILQVALRPVLMIFGLLGGLVVLLLMLSALNVMFSSVIPAVLDSGQIASLWFVLMSAVYAIMVLGLANASFKLIDWLPERTLTWLSGVLQPSTGQATAEDSKLTRS